MNSANGWETRRAFLKKSALAGGAVYYGASIDFQPALADSGGPGEKLAAAIIGHTGQGDYGHGLDLIFNGRKNIQVFAIADPVPAGRAKAAARCGALREYNDYHAMLKSEQPRLVCVAPRWTDQHHEMVLAALDAGAHVYLEKPITQDLRQADELLATAGRLKLKIAVAHQMRLAPNILHLKKSLEEGVLGELLQVHAFGKQDTRAGGEDMLVLGTHLFDLMRFFAGEAIWCSAQVLQNGHEITRTDARAAKENIGPIAGDEVEANFGFARGVTGTFTSRGRMQPQTGHWGIELVGSKARARILADIFPSVLISEPVAWKESGRIDSWHPLKNDPLQNASAAQRSTELANSRVVDDWLEAIAQDREPICSGHAAMKSLEMIMAVYEAALSGRRIALPLGNRKHPLV